jgi:hypothetical protein
VARRNPVDAIGRFGRYLPATRRPQPDAAVIPGEGHRLQAAVTLTGAGLLATTGLFGLGVVTASTSGAVVGVETGTTHAGIGEAVNTVNTGNDNSALTVSGAFAYAGTFGVASKHRCGTGDGFLGLGACVTGHDEEP